MNALNTVAPKIGQSVYVPFVTATDEMTGKVDYLGGCSMVPFDKIDAVYDDSKTSKAGKKIFGVRLKSGDRVDVVLKNQDERQTLWLALS